MRAAEEPANIWRVAARRAPCARTRERSRARGRLRAPEPLDARGIAAISELLSDGTGPLYGNDAAALAGALSPTFAALAPAGALRPQSRACAPAGVTACSEQLGRQPAARDPRRRQAAARTAQPHRVQLAGVRGDLEREAVLERGLDATRAGTSGDTTRNRRRPSVR